MRLFERFCLDGWAPMNMLLRRRQCHTGPVPRLTAAALTFAAAVVSPTANLHWFTGASMHTIKIVEPLHLAYSSTVPCGVNSVHRARCPRAGITLVAGYMHVRSMDEELGAFLQT